MPTNSEDTNLLHKVNNLYRELGDKPEVQRLMTLYPTNQLYSKWGGIPRGICKEVRSRYMLIEPSHGQYAQEIIICRGYEDLAKVDFKEAARLLPYRVLPNYSLDFTDADDINYARAFLFHMPSGIY